MSVFFAFQPFSGYFSQVSQSGVVLVQFNCSHCIVGIVYYILLWGVIPRTYRNAVWECIHCVQWRNDKSGIADAQFVRLNYTAAIAMVELCTQIFAEELQRLKYSRGIVAAELHTRNYNG